MKKTVDKRKFPKDNVLNAIFEVRQVAILQLTKGIDKPSIDTVRTSQKKV